jgi:predicted nucleic acid-binding Zn ribbon protein
MKIGKTIVGEREKAVSSSERIAIREKEQKRKVMSAAIFILGLILFIVLVVAIITNIVDAHKKNEIEIRGADEYRPTVDIIDEANAGYITDRIKKYVGQTEQDFYDVGYKVSRVILPIGKTRELDFYIEGREEYYKFNLDRGTAESVEDVIRMIRYLKEKNIKATYVDVRIAERAYYK